jgi:hypothetical protein
LDAETLNEANQHLERMKRRGKRRRKKQAEQEDEKTDGRRSPDTAALCFYIAVAECGWLLYTSIAFHGTMLQANSHK